jgi:hypothetical protein
MRKALKSVTVQEAIEYLPLLYPSVVANANPSSLTCEVVESDDIDMTSTIHSILSTRPLQINFFAHQPCPATSRIAQLEQQVARLTEDVSHLKEDFVRHEARFKMLQDATIHVNLRTLIDVTLLPFGYNPDRETRYQLFVDGKMTSVKH